MKNKAAILFLAGFFLISTGCASVSDSVISAIGQEQYTQLNGLYKLILDYRYNGNRKSLEKAAEELASIETNEIYNRDYKAQIIGLKSLSDFYLGHRISAARLLKELQEISSDEELYWIVSALMTGEKEAELELLLEGEEAIFDPDRLNSFLAEAYLKNEHYGEAAALYDSILLEDEDFKDYYTEKRNLAYLFLKTKPSSYETGLLLSRDSLIFADMIDALYIETSYFSQYDRSLLENHLAEKGYFFQGEVLVKDPLFRKDLAYFLFALAADRKGDGEMWNRYGEFYNPVISDEMKEQAEGMSPIPDVPLYKYYFYPVLYLIEQEIMELPDGEKFYPDESVSGKTLLDIIENLKKRID